MAISETARLIASLELKDLFTKNINNAEKSLNSFDRKLDSSQGRAFKAGQQIGTGIKRSAALAVGAVGFLAANVALGVKSLEELEQVTAQTNAVIKSTGGVAGQTSASIRDLAEKYENLNATMDDTVIQSGANVLLTFTNIRKQAFEPALKAALDLSTGMHQDLQSSVVQLGKALNDPIKGITALTRVGVTFTAGQKKQIEALIKSGKTLQAQKIIIAEINREFGGSFLAQGNTTAAKVEKFKDAVQDLQRALATALLPVIGRVSDALTKFLADPEVIKTMNDLGKSIAGLFSDQNLAAGAGIVQSAFKTIRAAAPVLQQSAQATFKIIEAAVNLFKQLPPEIQGLAVGGFAINKLTGGLITNIGGALIDLAQKSRGASPGNPVWVATAGGAAGLGGAGAAGKGGGLLSKALPIAGIVASVAAVIATQQEVSGQNQAIADGISQGIKQQIGGGASLGDLQKSLAAVNQGIAELESNPLSVLVRGDALDQLKQQNANLRQAIAQRTAGGVQPASTLLDRGGRELGQAGGKLRDDLNWVVDHLNAFAKEFKDSVDALRHAKTADQIKKAATAATKLVSSGRGNVEGTKSVISGLKSALAHTHDPKLAAILRADLAKVERKLPGRQFAAASLAKADKIARSNESQTRKISDLQAIERSLRDRGLPRAADRIRAKIDAAKAAQVAASKRAGQVAAAAIRDKEWRFTVNLPKPTITVREFANGMRVATNYTGGQGTSRTMITQG